MILVAAWLVAALAGDGSFPANDSGIQARFSE